MAEGLRFERGSAGARAVNVTWIVLPALTLLYAICVGGRAAGKPFWYDEIITLIAAQSTDLATTWRAALATDANPPLPHLLTHVAIRWFGLNEVTARIPAIAGFWTFCLCLFAVVRRRKGMVCGLCALMLPILTGAYYYAAEARAYGLQLGFCGLALLAWQSAAEGRRRVLAIPAIALSIAAMLFCHYYAVLVYLPLAGGELARTRRAGRIDWTVWAALAAGAAPLVWRMATIVTLVSGTSTTWAPAYLRQGIEFWESVLKGGAPYLALLLALMAVHLMRGRKVIGELPQPVPEHEWIAGALFIAIPLAGVIGALLVTHMFTERYALLGTVGFCWLAPMIAAEFLGTQSRAMAVLLGVLAWGTVVTLFDYDSKGNPFSAEPVLKEALEQGPVVIPDGQLFLQMWYYAPARLKSRLVYVLDRDAAQKYMGFDTIDAGISMLRPWVVNAVPYDDFVHSTHEFVAYQNALRPGWVLTRTLADGASVQVKKVALFRELVTIRVR